MKVTRKLRIYAHFAWQEFLCRVRHDYELREVLADGRVELACFYCGRRKVTGDFGTARN